MHVRIYVCIHVSVYDVLTHIYKDIYILRYKYIHMYVCMYIHMYVCMYVACFRSMNNLLWTIWCFLKPLSHGPMDYGKAYYESMVLILYT